VAPVYSPPVAPVLTGGAVSQKNCYGGVGGSFTYPPPAATHFFFFFSYLKLRQIKVKAPEGSTGSYVLTRTQNSVLVHICGQLNFLDGVLATDKKKKKKSYFFCWSRTHHRQKKKNNFLSGLTTGGPRKKKKDAFFLGSRRWSRTHHRWFQ
jgi:hypothetical protein